MELLQRTHVLPHFFGKPLFNAWNRVLSLRIVSQLSLEEVVLVRDHVVDLIFVLAKYVGGQLFASDLVHSFRVRACPHIGLELVPGDLQLILACKTVRYRHSSLPHQLFNF